MVGGWWVTDPGAGTVSFLDDTVGILYADSDLREGLRPKPWCDARGHHSREDLFVSEEPDEVDPESQEP